MHSCSKFNTIHCVFFAFILLFTACILNNSPIVVHADTIDPTILANLTTMVNITVTPMDSNISPAFYFSYAWNNLAQAIQPAISQSSMGMTAFLAAPDTISNDTWNPITLLIVLSIFNESAVPSFYYDPSYFVNYTISYDIISTSYDAITCTGTIDDASFIIINGTNGCSPTYQTALAQCQTDSDCADDLICVENWSQPASGLFPSLLWCVPENHTIPYTTYNYSIDVLLTETDPIDNLVLVQTSISDSIDLITNMNSDCVFNYSISSNDTNFEQNSTVLISMLAWNVSSDCQSTFSSNSLSVFGFTTVHQDCVNDLSVVPGVLTPYVSSLSTSVNTASSCGFNNQGFASCQLTTDCASGFQCGVLDVFDMPDVLACQYDLHVNMISYNITITPTDENPSPTNYTANYLYLIEILNELKQELNDNSCFALDSTQTSYIPDIVPYNNVVFFATHINTTDECLNIDMNDVAVTTINQLLVSTQATNQYSVSIVVTQFDDVSVEDCISSSSSSINIADSKCSVTANVDSTQITSCTSSSDCAKNYACVAVTSTDEKICLKDNASSTFTLSSIAMVFIAIMMFAIV